jgi:YidC/Oxa1 family membrane protein insertase
MDIQRTILLIIFGMSLVFLWDAWQKHQGRPSMLAPAPVVQKAGPADGKSAPAAPAAPAAAGEVPAAATPSAAVPAAADVPAAAGATATAATPAAATPPAERVRIETDLVRAEIDPTGAVLSRVELLQQDVAPDWTAAGLIGMITGKKHDPNANVVLLEWNRNRVYLARSGLTGPGDAKFPNHLSAFTPVPGPRELSPGQDTLEVKFESAAGGIKLVKTYVFKRGQYGIEVRHDIQNTGEAPVTPSIYLQLVRDGNKPEGESALYYTFTGPAVYSDAQKFQKINFSDIEKKKQSHIGEAKEGWIAMIQHYFVSAWVPEQGRYREVRTSMDGPNLFSVSTVMPMDAVAPGATSSSKATLWIGPQDQERLAAVAPGLDLVVDYGWLTFLSKPLFWLLQFLHNLVGNWGWAIVLLTVLVKLAFYPLSAASYRSMAKMKEVTPRMMALREKYGDDKQKLNMAMMELYKNEKIHPLGGCLPILVQIPVFIALYWVLLASVEMRNQPWILWVQDLATPDPWFILPVLMMASMWFQYKLNPTPPDPVQAKVMAAMPFIFGVMFFFFPAGLVLYWLVNNCISIAQQWYITKQIADAKKPG